jgi:hypothetical protein
VFENGSKSLVVVDRAEFQIRQGALIEMADML